MGGDGSGERGSRKRERVGEVVGAVKEQEGERVQGGGSRWDRWLEKGKSKERVGEGEKQEEEESARGLNTEE